MRTSTLIIIFVWLALWTFLGLTCHGQTVEIYTERGVLTNNPVLSKETRLILESEPRALPVVATTPTATPRPKPKPTATPNPALRSEPVTPLKP